MPAITASNARLVWVAIMHPIFAQSTEITPAGLEHHLCDLHKRRPKPLDVLSKLPRAQGAVGQQAACGQESIVS
jgi:hypothetical protein